MGEMMATAAKIKEGDFESWFTDWDKVARRVLTRADASFAAGHLESAREAYLRTSTYFRTAEFIFMAILPTRVFCRSRGDRKRRMPKQRSSLAQPGKRCKVHTKGRHSPDIFIRWTIPVSRGPHFHGGYDSSIEELFYSGAAAARRRGYNCLTFDGPGQGAPLREHKLSFRYAWEAVVTPAVDDALTRPDADRDK